MESLAQILAEAQAQDSVVRGRAAELLGAHQQVQACRMLTTLLDDEDPVVGFKAACSLVEHRNQTGLARLLWGLQQRDLCSMALEALLALGAAEALPVVREFFHRVWLHPLERVLAAAVLCRLDDAEGTEAFQADLASPRPEVQGFAIELLGRLGGDEARTRLESLAVDPQSPFRLDAVRGLAWLMDARSLPLLVRLSRDADEELAGQAAQLVTDLEDAPRMVP